MQWNRPALEAQLAPHLPQAGAVPPPQSLITDSELRTLTGLLLSDGCLSVVPYIPGGQAGTDQANEPSVQGPIPCFYTVKHHH